MTFTFMFAKILLDSFILVEGWSCVSTVTKTFSKVNTTAVLRFDLSADVNQQTFNTFRIGFYNNSIQAFVFYSGGTIITDQIPGVDITADLSGNVMVTKANVAINNAGMYYIYSSSTPTRCNCLYILGIPTKPSISVQNSPYVGGSEVLVCSSTPTTTPSNHSLSIMYSWRVDNTDNPSGSRYSYSSNRNTLTLSNVVKDDANKHFSCIATEDVNGGYTSGRSPLLRIGVIHGPDKPSVSVQSPYTVTEGDVSGHIECASDCYQTCSYIWTNAISGSLIRSNAILPLATMNRYMTGSYICTAVNTAVDYRKSSETTLNIIVQYAPYVSIDISTRYFTEGANVTLFCVGLGVPSLYTYTGLTQTISGVEIPNSNTALRGTHPYSSIHFPSLQLQDTGTYTCSLNNGISDTFGQLDQTDYVHINVQALPKILLERVRFYGLNGEDFQIDVPVYSFPDLETVNFTRYDGIEVATDNKYNITMQYGIVKTKFYDSSVSLNGSIIKLKIINLGGDDFGSYFIKLTNSRGSTAAKISVIVKESEKTSTTTYVIIGVTSSVVLIVVVATFFQILKKRRRLRNKEEHRQGKQRESKEPKLNEPQLKTQNEDLHGITATDPTECYECLQRNDEAVTPYAELSRSSPVASCSFTYENLELKKMSK